MKMKNNTVFLLSALCICLPIGLVLLFISEKTKWAKILIATSGAIVFFTLLVPSILMRETLADPADFQPIVTRSELSVGQSGGLTLANDTHYHTDYKVVSSNDCLSVNNNIYTATKVGVCDLTIQFNDQIRTVTITINDNKMTDSIVYATPKGSRYHANLKHGGKNSIEMTEEDALQSGKTPCKICWK